MQKDNSELEKFSCMKSENLFHSLEYCSLSGDFPVHIGYDVIKAVLDYI